MNSSFRVNAPLYSAGGLSGFQQAEGHFIYYVLKILKRCSTEQVEKTSKIIKNTQRHEVAQSKIMNGYKKGLQILERIIIGTDGGAFYRERVLPLQGHPLMMGTGL